MLIHLNGKLKKLEMEDYSFTIAIVIFSAVCAMCVLCGVRCLNIKPTHAAFPQPLPQPRPQPINVRTAPSNVTPASSAAIYPYAYTQQPEAMAVPVATRQDHGYDKEDDIPLATVV